MPAMHALPLIVICASPSSSFVARILLYPRRAARHGLAPSRDSRTRCNVRRSCSTNLTFIGPCGVSMIQSVFDFLTDLQNAVAHFGRFSGLETNRYTSLAERLIDTLNVRDASVITIGALLRRRACWNRWSLISTISASYSP